MESIYSQWPGMTLDKDYEDTLISLCVCILRYLDVVPNEDHDPGYEQVEDHLNACMVEINKADAKCREFAVTISHDVVHRGTKRKVEDFSDGDDDCDSMVVREGKKGKFTLLEALPSTG